ncbi:OPT oligopeptide transporter protein-domain-containing protein [Ephemerocybe angulata]|uniref:OPT oligopeptide transporter protein-domain-containing protein n=1 Tax=Ephemerocybe angulata TaxID=980116 RepID=A0A8H6M4D5_9AGAR|nr:OPT oligopeptide transporter protein-domain-containing protein [Tulosesus angulatus]
MYFTLYGYNTLEQGRTLMRDLKKCGQYTKLPPRVTFTVQTLGSIVGGLLNYVIIRVIISSQREILREIQGTNIWSGQQVQGFNASAITWGALRWSLRRTSPQPYSSIISFAVLIGLAAPLPFWLIHKRWPKIGANKVITPVLCFGTGYLVVGINSSVLTMFSIAMFSQLYLRRHRPRWFRKYNFLLSAALDGGTQVMVFVFTFALAGGSGKATEMPHWALVRIL